MYSRPLPSLPHVISRSLGPVLCVGHVIWKDRIKNNEKQKLQVANTNWILSCLLGTEPQDLQIQVSQESQGWPQQQPGHRGGAGGPHLRPVHRPCPRDRDLPCHYNCQHGCAGVLSAGGGAGWSRCCTNRLLICLSKSSQGCKADL